MQKILIAASTSNHLINFHLPYINELKKHYKVYIMAKNINCSLANFDIDFKKRIFSFKNIKNVLKIRKIIKRENFDTIFLNTSLAAFLIRLALIGLKNKPKVVNVVHGYLFSNNSNWLKKLIFLSAEKLVKKQTDYILTMNDEDTQIATKYSLCKEKIIKINGMGFNQKRVIRKHNKNKLNNNPLFVSVGELSDRKNHKFLIDAINKLKQTYIRPNLIIVGDGKKRNKLQRLINKKKLNNNISLVGYKDNIEKYLSFCNYYVCSSIIEGMPFNILEAMYNGCVVISSDIKGSKDVIKHSKNGILYNTNDVDDFVDKFMKIHSNLQLQKSLCTNAKITAEKYTLSAVFDNNIKLIKSLIG